MKSNTNAFYLIKTRNTVDGIRNAFATNEEFSASEIVQILRFISPNPASPTA